MPITLAYTRSLRAFTADFRLCGLILCLCDSWSIRMEALRDQIAISLQTGMATLRLSLGIIKPWQAASIVVAAVLGARLLRTVAGWAQRVVVLSRIPSPPVGHWLLGHAKAISDNK